MSGRLLFARRVPLVASRRLARDHRHFTSTAGGLLRKDLQLRVIRHGRLWPFGTYSLHNLNVPATRSISFTRALPNLVLKLVRIPAIFGGATIAGLAYIQYQAGKAGNYAVDVFRRASDTASDLAGGLYGNAKDIAEQTSKGWEKTRANIELPNWLQNILNTDGESTSGDGGSPGPGGSPKQSGAGIATAAGTSAAAFGYTQSPEDDDRSEEQTARDDQMMLLTKKMIEIRGILQTIGQSGTLTLPSIVVIGSQSSGKSSVLEAIVGHEFLPKGSNMVTRRPIELTLVNTPDAGAEYGEFPALGLGKIRDFSHIQKTLTDLNLAVPEADCVSDDPIQLYIYSPNVPDLSLIDLPGYIQVAGLDQPAELKQKIVNLCDRYLLPPNIILAISAADVDLANSTALRASRRVDPRGERTIGVVTKMDLVEPQKGADILGDRKYPLRLGYVGVVCRIPHSLGIFSRTGGNITNALTKNENAYFSTHSAHYGPDSSLSVGTGTLRKKLMEVLEQTMAASLQGTTDAIHQELDEATYEFKVQYNDRQLSAESYLAESLDAFKHAFRGFSERFGEPQVRELLKQELDQRVLNLLAKHYWNKPVEDLSRSPPELDPIVGLPKADPESILWHRKLDFSTSSLTKLGIGRLATTVVADALQSHIDRLITDSTFSAHPFARQVITEAASGILNERFSTTSSEVEQCIKPYKFKIKLEDSEWAKGRENVARVLTEELKACDGYLKTVENTVGGKKKLKDVMNFVDRVRSGDIVLEGDRAGGAGGFSSSLLQRGREAVFLRDRADIIKMRLMAVKSKQCANQKNKYYCPEVFLDVVANKLTSTAVLFLDVELLSEFYHNFPRELDSRLGKQLSDTDIQRFAREDPKIRGHLDLIERKEKLELVLEKIQSLRRLDGRERWHAEQRATPPSEGKGWGFF